MYNRLNLESQTSFHFLKTDLFYYFICRSILPACMSIYHMCSWSQMPQKSVESIQTPETRVPKGRELLGAENETGVLWKKCTSPLSHFSSPQGGLNFNR